MIQTRKSKYAHDEWHDRNQQMHDFFERLFGVGEIALVGDANKPAVIFKNKYLACYVHNYTLHFIHKCDGGNDLLVCRVDGTPEIEKVVQWYKAAKHERAYKIKILNAPLYVCGTSEIDGTPVFGGSGTGIHYYKTAEFALQLLNKFSLNNFCEVV